MTSSIVCDVCPRACQLKEGQTGFCNVRKNVNGENVDALYGLFYAFPEEYNLFAPGSYTVVFPGCNLKCWFCSFPFVSSGFTGDVSGWPTGAYRELSPKGFVQKVKAHAGPERYGLTCGLMGFFGGEPAIHPEYIVEAGRLAHGGGCASKIHTNGFISEHVMRQIAGAVNIVSVNVKGSASRSVYECMNAMPDSVLRSIKVAWETPRVDGGVGVKGLEVRNLVGPGPARPQCIETERFGAWLAENTSPDIKVLVEVMTKPRSCFLDRRVEHEELYADDTIEVARERLLQTGWALHDGGLQEVLVLAPGIPGCNIHIPSGKPFRVV